MHNTNAARLARPDIPASVYDELERDTDGLIFLSSTGHVEDSEVPLDPETEETLGPHLDIQDILFEDHPQIRNSHLFNQESLDSLGHKIHPALMARPETASEKFVRLDGESNGRLSWVTSFSIQPVSNLVDDNTGETSPTPILAEYTSGFRSRSSMSPTMASPSLSPDESIATSIDDFSDSSQSSIFEDAIEQQSEQREQEVSLAVSAYRDVEDIFLPDIDSQLSENIILDTKLTSRRQFAL